MPTDTTWTAGAIRRLRDAYDETQHAFARRIGVAPKTVQDWEYGRRTPNRWLVKELDRLAKKRGW